MASFAPVVRRSLRPRLVARGLATASPPSHVRIVEVGPRDGLQNEKQSIPLATKLGLIERLAKTGLSTIEAGAFVSPKWVPQMSNSTEILQHLLQHGFESPAPVTYSFLAPNTKGLEAATSLLANTRQSVPLEIDVFASATESFSRANTNCSVAESLDRCRPVVAAAKRAGLRVRAYISVVLGCPFEGRDVDPGSVAALATDLLEMGADEIALGDTTGMGTAPRTRALLAALRRAGVRDEDLALHLHDTYGQALVNAAAALDHGVRVLDGAVAGLGGCPYSPGATGNAATEDLVYFVESLGLRTGVDLDALADAGAWIAAHMGRPSQSAVGNALLGARARREREERERAAKERTA